MLRRECICEGGGGGSEGAAASMGEDSGDAVMACSWKKDEELLSRVRPVSIRPAGSRLSYRAARSSRRYSSSLLRRGSSRGGAYCEGCGGGGSCVVLLEDAEYDGVASGGGGGGGRSCGSLGVEVPLGDASDLRAALAISSLSEIGRCCCSE